MDTRESALFIVAMVNVAALGICEGRSPGSVCKPQDAVAGFSGCRGLVWRLIGAPVPFVRRLAPYAGWFPGFVSEAMAFVLGAGAFAFLSRPRS